LEKEYAFCFEYSDKAVVLLGELFVITFKNLSSLIQAMARKKTYALLAGPD